MRPAVHGGVLATLDDVTYMGRADRNEEHEVTPQSPEALDRPRPVRIRTLGRFTLEVDRETVRFDRRAPRRVLELLKCIIALGVDGASCDALASALWPDSEGDAACTALEVALHRLRKVLGHKRTVQLSHGVIWPWSPSVVWVDAAAFEALADRANGEHGAVHLDVARRALALYGGPFLQNDAETAWLLPRRATRCAAIIPFATRTADHYEQAGDLAQAAETLRHGPRDRTPVRGPSPAADPVCWPGRGAAPRPSSPINASGSCSKWFSTGAVAGDRGGVCLDPPRRLSLFAGRRRARRPAQSRRRVLPPDRPIPDHGTRCRKARKSLIAVHLSAHRGPDR